MRKPAKNSIGKKVALLAASGLAALCLTEVLVRFHPDSHRLLLSPSSIPGVGYQAVPGSTAILGGERVRFNRWGFRYEDFPEEKPAGEFRIFALGDSVAYGQGMGSGLFTEILEQKLGAVGFSSVPGRIRVINTAVPSYSTCQELALLQGLLARLEPDLILVNYVLNDPEGARTPFGLDLETGKLPLMYRIYHGIKQNIKSVQFAATRLSTIVVRLRGTRYYGPEEDQRDTHAYAAALHDPAGRFWKRCSECIQGFGEYQERSGVPVLLTIFPEFNYLHDKTLTGIYAQVRETAQTAGLSVLDLRPYFASLGDARAAAMHLDGIHLTALGHDTVAEIIFSYLRKNPSLFPNK